MSYRPECTGKSFFAIFMAGVAASSSANAKVELNELTQVNQWGGADERRSGVMLAGAVPVDGVVFTVDAKTPLNSYLVMERGVLNIIDWGVATHVQTVNATVKIDRGTVEEGVFLSNSKAYLNHALVRNETGFGVSLGASARVSNPGSTAEISSSDISGVNAGIAVGIWGRLKLVDTNVYGTKQGSGAGLGILTSGGDVLITQGSHVSGDINGINIIDGTTAFGITEGAISSTVIDNSVIEGINGAAIRIDRREATDMYAAITVRNNSALRAGNGNLLEVTEFTTADLVIDDSTLNGNLFADDTSILNVTLQNNAQLTGDIVNGSALAITSGGGWQMQGDGAIQSLAMDGGHVGFDSEGFHTLSTNGLSGRGTFDMRVDLDNGVGDLLKVNGKADGEFELRVRNTGVEVVSADMQPLKVVHTEGGDAQFSLIGGRVDLGAYSYLLEQQGNDWFIVGDGKVVSPSTQSALALFNAAPTIWLSELSTLRSRMGEVRSSGQGGAWMRGYGNRLNASTPDVDYRQTQSGLSLGADAPVEVSSGQLLFGVLGGYSKSDLDLSRGTTGKIDSYYVGAYGTWLSEDGYYLDGVLKLNRFRNKANVAMSDASKAKGDYTNNGVGGWVEFGRHIKLADDYFLEPFAQLSSVVVQGQDFRMDNGLQAKNDHTRSVLAKAGTSVGRSIALKDGGMVQPYVRVAVAQELSRRNEVKVNDVRFDNGLFGSRAELGAGVSVSLSERLQVHADFDFMKGKHIEQPWGANVGLRLAF